MKWNIVLDSSCDLEDAVLEDGIGQSIVPMKVIIDNQEFIDNPSLDIEYMMKRMKESKVAAGSACPSPGEFAERFSWAENSICITMTAALSGTNDSALHGAIVAKEADSSKNIHVFDSAATAGKMVLMAEEAIRLIREGKAFEEVVAGVEAAKSKIKLYFSLASFDNLIKNGRMPKYQGMLGSILNIRPVAHATPEGTIEVLDRPRGEKAMLRKMVERMQAAKDLTGLKIIIDHVDNFETATKLKEAIEAVAKVKEIVITPTKGLCSFYADYKGMLIAF